MKNFVVFAVLISLCGCTLSDVEKGVVTLTGTITIYDESNVLLTNDLRGFRVDIIGTDKETLTDETGRFSFSQVRSGRYFIRISGKGFPAHIRPLHITSGARGTVNFDMLFTKRISTTVVDTLWLTTDYGRFPQQNSNLYYNATISPADAKLPYRGVLVFFDTTEAVNHERYIFAAECINGLLGISSSVRNADFPFSFRSGMRIYAAAYGITALTTNRTGYFLQEIYQEPISGNIIFPFIHTNSRKVAMLQLP